jgi:peroxiredoxin Q/BCP
MFEHHPSSQSSGAGDETIMNPPQRRKLPAPPIGRSIGQAYGSATFPFRRPAMALRLASALCAAALLIAPFAASAALPVGAKAPDFATRGAVGGKPFALKLSQQLRKGPVVLYFFPAAFTQGCTLEAHEFAEAAADFHKAGASVIGLSADPVDKLTRFSVEECRNKFPVATATPAIIAAYDVKLPQKAGLTNRTSYVITPDDRIAYVHSDLDYKDHVRNTLAAVRAWQAGRKQP